jgi:3-oxoacyl-[acyl-carrier protein] reductase
MPTDGKPVALVTGGSRGIGRAISLELASRGHFVIVNYVSQRDKAEETLQTIRDRGGCGMIYQADVTIAEEVQRLFKDIYREHRRVDVLINNAGVTRDEVFMMMNAAQWQKVVDTNLNAVFHCSKAAVRLMVPQKRGVIVHIGSGSGLSPRRGQVNYSTTKSAILGFSRSLAREVAGHGVRVLVVAPGFTRTEMADSVPPSVVSESLRMIPMGRWGKPEEIANVVGFACSEDAGFLTGVTLVVDGGRAGAEQDYGPLQF